MHNHEVVEAKCGVAFREYDVRPDSGGPGRWRGGAGQVLTLEALRNRTTLVIGGLGSASLPGESREGGTASRRR